MPLKRGKTAWEAAKAIGRDEDSEVGSELMNGKATLTWATYLTALAGWTACAWAQEGGPGPIRWRTEAGATKAVRATGEAASAAAGKSGADAVLAPAGRRHVVLQFDQIPTSGEQADLEQAGVKLLRYLGDNAYFARVSGGTGAAGAARGKGLRQALSVRSDWKLHPRLAAGNAPDYARFTRTRRAAADEAASASRRGASKATEAAVTEEMLALYVMFHPDVDMDKTATVVVGRHDGMIRSVMRTIHAAVVWLPEANLAALAAEDEVQWIEPPLPPFDVTNNSVRAAVGADSLQASPYDLDGTGINVLVYDGGTALATHADFGGRLTVRDDSGLDEHPTHVAGTVGGNGSLSAGLYRGMAPNCHIDSFGFEYDGTGQFLYTNPGDIEADYDQAINTYGCVIANNSIGTNVAPNNFPCEWEGDYGVTDVLIDSIVRGSLGSPMRVIWANGNERGSGRCGSAYHTTAPPACAKNHITVGAVNSNDLTMTSFSSWGPADDGRLKPDITAPGCEVGGADSGVTSTVSSGQYGVMCGTSMAAPAVTGLCALILQDWLTQFPGSDLPTNAMLKVLLAHNAIDLGNTGPDYQFGYGMVRGPETIEFIRNGSFVEDGIQHGEQKLFFVPVTSGSSELKVTLAWDDPPGAVNTAPELVNDLDLVLISPDGATYHYPWTLDPENGDLPAVRTQADHLNNIEQVVVDGPATGTWTARVTGYSVALGPQSFSLASTPELRFCSSAGTVLFGAEKYGCESVATIAVNDCDLDTDPQTAQTVTVKVQSLSEVFGENVVLTEKAPGAALFEGSIPLSLTDAPGILKIQPGQMVQVTYIDADNGKGGHNLSILDTAVIDCQSPSVGPVSVESITSSSAVVSFSTDELAQPRIRFGTSCGALTNVQQGNQFATSHHVTLTNLDRNITYFFQVEVSDEAGNTTIDNNGGACYSFTTADRQSYFTELFEASDFDLAGRVMTFTPTEALHYYQLCQSPATALAYSPSSSTSLNLTDDSSIYVALEGGKTFPFYGVPYDGFYIGSNGYITFGVGDNDYTESLDDHFRLPRISVLFDDWNPIGGRVSWKQLSDRVVITWLDVPEYGANNASTFQVMLHFDGTIDFVWVSIATVDGLVGLSQGTGIPSDFMEEDLSLWTGCSILPTQAFGPTPDDGNGIASILSKLQWTSGLQAASHDVYFGTTEGGLSFQGNQTSNQFSPGLLVPLTTYYWRIDEVNANGTTPGMVWSFQTTATKADFDHDLDVDLTDFAHLQLCFTGKDVPQDDPTCQDAKLDADADVDAEDAALFESCLTGPQIPADGTCIP